MCQVIISTVAQTRPGGYRAGDVICVRSDEQVFSPAELTEPKWQIVSLPGLSASALNAFRITGAEHARRRATLEAGSLPATLSGRQALDLFATAMERT